jgi:hypothetical protein
MMGHMPKSNLGIYTAPSTPSVLSSLDIQPMFQAENAQKVKSSATRPPKGDLDP